LHPFPSQKHPMMILPHIMPDFPSFLDLSNLFVAISGILFSAWYGDIERVLAEDKPLIYKNRKSYISRLVGTIISKSAALTLVILIYLVSLSGQLFLTISHSNLTINPSQIDPVLTLFCLTYWLSVYLFTFSAYQLFCLIGSWWRSGVDRPAGVPRITLLR
jgi:hypothetical protein